MSALAEVLIDAGWSLSGSDLSLPGDRTRKLIERGLTFFSGHSESHVLPSARYLIYSPAIVQDNVERATAALRQIPQFSYSQMVGRLMRDVIGVCISGTHGKSTTTAMTACILDDASRLSAVVIGAELCSTGRSGWSGAGDLFVAESCEYQHSFLDFAPKYSAILGIEPDHFDCYPDLASIQTAFREFASRTAADGVLLVNADCPASCAVSVMARTSAKRVTFGDHPTADWQSADWQPSPTGSRFRLVHRGCDIIGIELPLFGRHNARNALAAAAFCMEIGISAETVRNSLATFRGIRRRLEFVGQWRGATLVDDYAHHPTAVRITLETLRNLVGTRTIRCIFQPHQVLRTTTLMADFAASFGAADQVLIAPVFAARESVNDEPRAVSQQLADRIESLGISARFCASLDQIVNTLEDAARPGDVIVTMGAGDIDRIHYELTQRIQRDPAT